MSNVTVKETSMSKTIDPKLLAKIDPCRVAEIVIQKHGKEYLEQMLREIADEYFLSNVGRKYVRRFPRSGITVQSRHESHEFQEASAYLVQIGKKWFRVERTSCPVFNREKQDSDNMLKWSGYGKSEQFSIEPCNSPRQWLPDIVSQFVDKHITTGCSEAEFVVHHKQMSDHVPAGAKEGWQEKKQK